MSEMSAPAPARLSRLQVRLLVLVALLLLVIGFALGYQLMTLQELAGQVAQGLPGVLVALVLGSR